MSLVELRALFSGFVMGAPRVAANFDDDEARLIAGHAANVRLAARRPCKFAQHIRIGVAVVHVREANRVNHNVFAVCAVEQVFEPRRARAVVAVADDHEDLLLPLARFEMAQGKCHRRTGRSGPARRIARVPAAVQRGRS